MATKTLEARFEHLSVSDENDSLSVGKSLNKPKVCDLENIVGREYH